MKQLNRYPTITRQSKRALGAFLAFLAGSLIALATLAIGYAYGLLLASVGLS